MSVTTCWAEPQAGRSSRAATSMKDTLYQRFIVFWIGVRVIACCVCSVAHSETIGHHGKRFVRNLHIVFIGQAFVVYQIEDSTDKTQTYSEEIKNTETYLTQDKPVQTRKSKETQQGQYQHHLIVLTTGSVNLCKHMCLLVIHVFQNTLDISQFDSLQFRKVLQYISHSSV